MKKKSKSKRYIALEVTGVYIGLIGRLFRSVLFNVLMFILGFGCGYVYIASMVNHYAKQNEKYESLREFKACLKQQREVDKRLDWQIEQMTLKLAHEMYEECPDFPGKYLNVK